MTISDLITGKVIGGAAGFLLVAGGGTAVAVAKAPPARTVVVLASPSALAAAEPTGVEVDRSGIVALGERVRVALVDAAHVGVAEVGVVNNPRAHGVSAGAGDVKDAVQWRSCVPGVVVHVQYKGGGVAVAAGKTGAALTGGGGAVSAGASVARAFGGSSDRPMIVTAL